MGKLHLGWGLKKIVGEQSRDKEGRSVSQAEDTAHAKPLKVQRAGDFRNQEKVCEAGMQWESG